MRAGWIRIVLVALWLIAGAAAGAPPAAADHDISFGEPEAQAVLGEPIVFRTTLRAGSEPAVVELLLSAPGERAINVLPAQLARAADGWEATSIFEGHAPPNTRFNFRFRVRDAAGHVNLSPAGEAVVEDARFDWRTIEGGVIRLHWYSGDEAFARRALQIGEDAVANASELLGVRETEPIDFFIYDSEAALRGALGPGTRENVGGQAHSDIRTLFGLIEPSEINSDWVDTLVAHELTHLVFDTATDNPYHSAPRWLNEGVAVYLSEGYTASWRAAIEEAVASSTIIPLDGLGGLFPTTALEFRLAYAESVSAVDFFIRSYDESTLWALVRSYAQGVSDNEAFSAATGADLAAFNAAWMADLGLAVPEPHGPRPGPPGPLPPGWDTAGETPPVPASPQPEQTPRSGTPSASAAPATAAPGQTPVPGAGEHSTANDLPLYFGLGFAAVLGVVLLALLARRRLLT